MKKYISRSSVSFSILVDGRERRIRFTESSRGGSVFLCDDEKICKLIEARRDFGTVYRLDPFFPGNFKGKTAPAQENEPAVPPAQPVIPPAAPETTVAEREIADETPDGSVATEDQGGETVPSPVEDTVNDLPVDDEAGAVIEENPEEAVEDAVDDVFEDDTIVAEVQTLSEAKEYLKLLGAQPTALRSKAGIVQTAQSLGISFPNLQ